MKNFLLKLCGKKNHKTAFSLIELSIVIVIVSILITGALSASVSSVNNAKIKITNERIQTIYKALGTYVMVNGYLPCPGNIASVKSTSANYGGGTGEISTTAAGACTTNVSGVYSNIPTTTVALAYGMVPVRALGLSDEFAEDGFESKFTYIVDVDFTIGSSNTYPGKAYTSLSSCTVTYPSTSIITIQEKPAGTAQTVTTAAIFAIISHGANKAGAYNPNSAAQNTRSSDADEQDNDLTNVSGTTAEYDRVLKISSGNSSSFDDIVFYKTRDQLVQDFKAFSFVVCPTCSQENYGTGNPNITWPQGVYDEAVVDNQQCPSGYRSSVYSPVRKCGALGQWGPIIWPCTSS